MPGIQVPQRQVLGPRIRLPLPQRPTERIVRSLQGNMMSADALRRSATSRSGIAKGYLPAVQVFTTGYLYPNTPPSLLAGVARTGTYKAGVGQGRGQSAGM